MNTSIRNNSLTAVIGNKVYSADSSHPNWVGIMDAVRANSDAALVSAINIRQAVVNFVKGKVKVVGNEVWFGDLQIGGVVVDRLLSFIADGLPSTPILRFIENLHSNPSQRAVTELYTFLEHKNLPITQEGNFLAYKGIQNNCYSITSGKLTLLSGKTDRSGHIFNGVGEVVECVRNQVDDNRDNTCSTGIHAGSLEYATSFGRNGRVVIVEINPKDVVSIPSDCEGQKLRTCKYKVVGIFEGALDSTYNNKYSITADDANEIGSDSDEQTYEEGYEEGYANGLATGQEDKEGGLKSQSASIKIDDDWDEGYLNGYVDGYDSATVKGPVSTKVVSAQAANNLSVQCYKDGYRAGRIDSRTHNKRNTNSKSTSYIEGYSDGYKHKVKKHK